MENNLNQYLVEQLANKEMDCNVTQFKKLQKEYYKQCHETCNLKVGDKVKITRSWTIGEYCTPLLWNPEFFEYIGNIFEIKEKHNFTYILNNGFHFPYFVLEKVEEEFVPLDYNDDLVGTIVVSNPGKNRHLIITQIEKGCFVGSSNCLFTYQDLMSYFTFQDGLPCHKLKQ